MWVKYTQTGEDELQTFRKLNCFISLHQHVRLVTCYPVKINIFINLLFSSLTISLVIIKALLTTFKQPLASDDTPKHSSHKLRRQRRFTTTSAGLKQSSSLDCLDERSSSQDLVTQSLNISSAASSAAEGGDLLTRSLGSFQGQRSLSSVSINVDSGEKVRL